MFSNIGKKIKALAKVVCWIGIICSILAGIGVIVGGNTVINYNGTNINAGNSLPAVVIGILTMVIGALASWLGSFMVYGFGELIDKTTENNEYLKKIADK